MSRQFDEAQEWRFNIGGEEYEIVEPESLKELCQALDIKSRLETQVSALQHDEDSSKWDELLQMQENYIAMYVENLDKFDNSKLASNIAYLCKSAGLRISDLETALSISAGYISRTMKQNSKKKMSIDLVWKISKMFGRKLEDMITKELWVPHGNIDLLESFINRLRDDTEKGYFGWESDGGCITKLDSRYIELGLVSEENAEEPIYHPRHMNREGTWILCDDIVRLECFDGEKDLAIIPYACKDGKSLRGFDFINIWGDEGSWHWERVFYTADDPYGYLVADAEDLYQSVKASALDVDLTQDVREVISQYLSSSQPD